ncbi:MAG TPA: hypothetical protein VMW83_09665 [Spirochaetia bacterium]|nr:hypothetical protein [Spirochaetia bacterium]
MCCSLVPLKTPGDHAMLIMAQVVPGTIVAAGPVTLYGRQMVNKGN